MAEEGQNLWSILPFHHSSITILSWNLGGEANSRRGPRNLLIPHLVSSINPDVLLLQEVPSKLVIEKIKRQTLSQGRAYVVVDAGDEKEARILYDSNVFTRVHGELNLDDMVEEVFLGEQNQKTEVQNKLWERVAVAKLRHRYTRKVFVFMSFHNVYKDRCLRRLLTDTFCQIMSAHRGPDDPMFLAGADLNCDINPFNLGEAHIPKYDLTRRRKGKKEKLDYFIASDNILGQVTAPNIFNANRFKQLWRAVRRANNQNYTKEQFKAALDHDPLVYKLILE